ncbi:MAG: HD domain-containing protein [Lachnospiraceae bacterium]|nr:HD domain-containing protein [Lachnospiraceae bacterium]
MDYEKFKKQMDFLLEIDKAKKIVRQTYISDASRQENDAEHSWHMAVMAFLLAEYFDSPDVFKTIKMVLIHDLVEIYAGDTYCYDESGYEDKEKRETESAKKLFGLLPEGQEKEFFELWREFEDMQTKEAVFASILDRLQPLMLNYAAKGISWLEHGIISGQVRKRDAIFKNGPEVINKYLEEVLSESIKKGYMIK